MKRFTDTDKWRDPWFRKLSPAAKLAFLYLVDNCDAAGVWDADKELADFTIGKKVEWENVLTQLGERVTVLRNGKWHLNRFIQFQYGTLSPDCRPHAAIIALLERHGIAPEGKAFDRVSKGYPKGLENGDGQPDAKPTLARRPNPTAVDEAWLESLRAKDCYRPLNIPQELEKAQAWCGANQRECSRRFFVNWLNRSLESARLTPPAAPKPKNPNHEDPAGWREFLVAKKVSFTPIRFAPEFLKKQFAQA